MEHIFGATQPSIDFPIGLVELMSDISRVVLRYQPDAICEFIADYLDALLISRRELCASVSRRPETFDLDLAVDQRAVNCLTRHKTARADADAQLCDIRGMSDGYSIEQLPKFDQIRPILIERSNDAEQKEIAQKIIDHDYRWINETVEWTFECYRKRQRTADALRMAITPSFCLPSSVQSEVRRTEISPQAHSASGSTRAKKDQLPGSTE